MGKHKLNVFSALHKGTLKNAKETTFLGWRECFRGNIWAVLKDE